MIGRLARDVRMRGKNFGEVLVADAIRRILGAARTLAVLAITVEAKDARAASFYEALGFIPFPQRPDRLFLLSASAARTLEKL